MFAKLDQNEETKEEKTKLVEKPKKVKTLEKTNNKD